MDCSAAWPQHELTELGFRDNRLLVAHLQAKTFSRTVTSCKGKGGKESGQAGCCLIHCKDLMPKTSHPLTCCAKTHPYWHGSKCGWSVCQSFSAGVRCQTATHTHTHIHGRGVLITSDMYCTKDTIRGLRPPLKRQCWVLRRC